MPVRLHYVIWIAIATLLASCSEAMPNVADYTSLPHTTRSLPQNLPADALITYDTSNGWLAYWPIEHNGSQSTPIPLSGTLGLPNVYGLAADGDVVVMTSYNPPQLVTYNVKTAAVKKLGDPYGDPVDVAIDKNGNYYAMNLKTVTVYKKRSSKPSELACSLITDSVAIGVDNEGDVFINGNGPATNTLGVFEYPAKSGTCKQLHLRPELGYPAGIGVDPKTDALLVVDNPGVCAGGLEGRLLVYPKPYRARDAFERDLGATYCAGTFRLDARSRHLFLSDATVSAGRPIIDQFRYPSGKNEGRYWEGYFTSGGFSGITTIPNALPN